MVSMKRMTSIFVLLCFIVSIVLGIAYPQDGKGGNVQLWRSVAKSNNVL